MGFLSKLFHKGGSKTDQASQPATPSSATPAAGTTSSTTTPPATPTPDQTANQTPGSGQPPKTP